MTDQSFSAIWHRRLRYMLSPQWDIYASLPQRLANKRVLEVGCGTGSGTLLYAIRAKSVDALDIDENPLAFAAEMYPLPNVRWILADVANWYTPERYDCAIAIETLEHVPDWYAALRNIRDFLVPGGEFIMSARNANADLRRWKELHERELTAQQLLETLKEFFVDCRLYDYSLTREQWPDSRMTPLVAVARKAADAA